MITLLFATEAEMTTPVPQNQFEGFVRNIGDLRVSSWGDQLIDGFIRSVKCWGESNLCLTSEQYNFLQVLSQGRTGGEARMINAALDLAVQQPYDAQAAFDQNTINGLMNILQNDS